MQKAKIIHPDATPHHDSSAHNRKEGWVELLTAYQILSDTRSRHLYDLSRSSSSSSFLRQAAASGVKHGIHEDVEIDLNWNLGRAWTHPSNKNQENNNNNNDGKNSSKTTTVLDHLKSNLESDWHVAIRHAYLGPRLDDLEHGQFPDCFEADERATDTTNEVLQLVSGRQELGSVRLRTASMLSESEKKAWLGQGECNYTGVEKDPALLAAFEVAGLTPPNKSEQKQSEEDDAQTKHFSSRKETETAPQDKTNNIKTSRQPQIVDLYLDDELIATAVSRPAAVAASPATTLQEAEEKENDDESIQGVLSTYFYRGDSLIAQLIEEEPSLATTRRYSASKLLDPSGQHIFSILRNTTPLVRHITFVAEHTTTASPSPQKESTNISNVNLVKKKTVVARAQRAWLPPSSLWLFKPRSYDHDIGGWVISWAGESQRDHPLWLDPSVLTLVAALGTLDYEKAKQQPYGLFERLRRGGDGFFGNDGGSSGGSVGSVNGGGRKVLEWVRDILRFHRGPK